jgi:hypothetical protein
MGADQSLDKLADSAGADDSVEAFVNLLVNRDGEFPLHRVP